MVERAREVSAAADSKVQSVVVTFDPHPSHVLHSSRRTAADHSSSRRSSIFSPLPASISPSSSRSTKNSVAGPRDSSPKRVLHDSTERHRSPRRRDLSLRPRRPANLASLDPDFGRDLDFTVRAYGRASSTARPSLPAASVRSSPPATSLMATLSRPTSPSSPRPRPAAATARATPFLPSTSHRIQSCSPPSASTSQRSRSAQPPNTRTFQGVTNVGNRPTFGADSFAVETHLLDFEPHRPRRIHTARAHLPASHPRRAPLRFPRSPPRANSARHRQPRRASSPGDPDLTQFSCSRSVSVRPPVSVAAQLPASATAQRSASSAPATVARQPLILHRSAWFGRRAPVAAPRSAAAATALLCPRCRRRYPLQPVSRRRLVRRDRHIQLLLRSVRARELLIRPIRQRDLHEVHPDRQRRACSGLLLAQRSPIVKSNPRSARHRWREPDEPRIRIVVGRSRLSAQRVVHLRRAAAVPCCTTACSSDHHLRAMSTGITSWTSGARSCIGLPSGDTTRRI